MYKLKFNNDDEICPDCHGSGIVGEGTCSACNGAGVI